MAKCSECNRTAKKDKPYCFQHDPTVSDETKKGWKAKGGFLSKRVSAINPDDILPIKSIDGLLDFYNLVIADALAMPNSLKRAKVLSDIGAKLGQVLELQHIISLDERLRILEAQEVLQVEANVWQVKSSEI